MTLERIREIWFEVFVNSVKYYPRECYSAMISYAKKILARITKRVLPLVRSSVAR